MEAYDNYDNGALLKNRYAKVSDISQGSYGLVSLAKDTERGDALVAVKYIYPVNYKSNQQVRQLSNTTGRATSSPAKLRSNHEFKDAGKTFMTVLHEESTREIAIHKILGDHPNIPQLIDHFDSCLILEYCSRGDLYEAMQNDIGPTTSQDIKDVFDQILSAISYCHSKSVFHRDLKPENILISRDWTIKICDWGLATTTQKVTNPNEFDIGSERYMAPELFDPDAQFYDAAKVDLWSLGVILLTLVFHKNPFQVANYTDKRFLQFSSNREALFDFFSSMTGEMFSALRFCLNLDPSNRDLESFRSELLNINYFTIDEEYWASHSDDEEEFGYDEDEELEPRAKAEEFDMGGGLFDFDKDHHQLPHEQQEEFAPNGDHDVGHDGHLDDHHDMPPAFRHEDLTDDALFNGKVDHLAHNEEPHDVPQIESKNAETAESEDIVPTISTEQTGSDEEEMPYNRRADALLSPVISTRPIPIDGGNQIRNTRKPFGVASFNKNGAFSFSKNFHHHNRDGRAGSQGGKFRREDFFTPRSVFTHYMDKYGEQRDQRDHQRSHDKRKKWTPAKKKYSWKKGGNSQANGSSHGEHGSKHRQNNRKRRTRPTSSHANQLAPFSGQNHVYGNGSTNASTVSNFGNGTAGQSAPFMSVSYNGSKTKRYVPPQLRSPQSSARSPGVGAVSEQLGHLELHDDEVFMLDDVDGWQGHERKNAFHHVVSMHDNGNSSEPSGRRSESRHATGAPRRFSASKGEASAGGKYIPPFRRGSCGGAGAGDKKRTFQPVSTFPSIESTLMGNEASRSVPGENWLMKKNWRD